ncbi:hypothetical protein [Streptomyces sp. NPDC056707]|uniref:hypothetical protein n=1 Tax=Streptomyces sp. NPDC056707 TaxID=3345919 RepID=UPI00367ADE87
MGDDVDLGEQRARPTNGASYSWFPRACADAEACAKRVEMRSPDPLYQGLA